jgi:hypothetical protein
MYTMAVKINKNISINEKNWKETAKDRKYWGDLAEKAKPHKGL